MDHHLLVIKDDACSTRPITDLLRDRGYTVATASNFEFFVDPGLADNFDLVVIDHSELRTNAIDICTELRQRNVEVPVVVLAARNRVQGWACYEAATGIWLLNAVPPTQDPSAPVPVPVPQQPPGIYQQAPPPIVYQPAPTVIYQQPVPTVIYQQPAPTVIYQQPVVVQSVPHRPIIVAPAYPSSVVLGTAAIDAAGRIASAAIIGSHRGERYYSERRLGHGHRW